MINDHKGGVVVPPLSEPTDCPRSARKAPWSTRGPTLKKKHTVHYSDAAPTVSAVQPVYPAARTLSRGRNRARENRRSGANHSFMGDRRQNAAVLRDSAAQTGHACFGRHRQRPALKRAFYYRIFTRLHLIGMLNRPFKRL